MAPSNAFPLTPHKKSWQDRGRLTLVYGIHEMESLTNVSGPCLKHGPDDHSILISFQTPSDKEKCTHTVYVLESMGETKRVMLAVTITLSGELFLPLLIFKDNKNGSIRK